MSEWADRIRNSEPKKEVKTKPISPWVLKAEAKTLPVKVYGR